MKTEICLPFPPSVNTYYRKFRNVMVLSAKGRQFKAEVKRMVIENKVPAFGTNRLSMKMVLKPRDKRRIDIDNRLKAVLDSLQDAGVYEDDWQIDFLQIQRGEQVQNGCIVVTIELIESPQSQL